MQLPPNHPKRFDLNDEVHARPPEALGAPSRITFLAMYTGGQHRVEEFRHISELCEKFSINPPDELANHFSAEFPNFRLKWERHSEFTRYKFITPAGKDEPFSTLALSAVPSEWISNVPGRIIVASHVELISKNDAAIDHDVLDRNFFSGKGLIGSSVASGAASAFADFRVQADGFSRLLIYDNGMTPRQAGRTIQRLLEIDTYRMMALLALPVAQKLAPLLIKFENELVKIASSLVSSVESDEPMLLERLTKLEAEMASSSSESYYRFSASAAYYDLVERRIIELREERISGLQTFKEFIERRMTPAMKTCVSIAARQNSLSERMAHASQLLSTRVDITREKQNQALLESMDRRGKLQLRLQQTVEGLSIAAVTYYVVGLVGYLAKMAKSFYPAINADVVVGIAIPITAVLAGIVLRRIRKAIGKPSK